MLCEILICTTAVNVLVLVYISFVILYRIAFKICSDRTLDMVDEAKVNVIDKRLSAMVKSMDDRFSTMVGQGGSCLQLMRNAEMNTSKAYGRWVLVCDYLLFVCFSVFNASVCPGFVLTFVCIFAFS